MPRLENRVWAMTRDLVPEATWQRWESMPYRCDHPPTRENTVVIRRKWYSKDGREKYGYDRACKICRRGRELRWQKDERERDKLSPLDNEKKLTREGRCHCGLLLPCYHPDKREVWTGRVSTTLPPAYND